MISSLITSQTRIRLLRKFFLNSNTKAHLRGLEAEFGESTNGLRIELNRMESAELLSSQRDGNKKLYYANRKHPLFNEIHNIIIKDTGIDRIVEKVVHRLGRLIAVYLVGDMARGHDTNNIELVLIGDGIDCEYLGRKVKQAKSMTGRSVSCRVLGSDKTEEFVAGYEPGEILLLWKNNGNVENSY
jgi:hypothetical protein